MNTVKKLGFITGTAALMIAMAPGSAQAADCGTPAKPAVYKTVHHDAKTEQVVDTPASTTPGEHHDAVTHQVADYSLNTPGEAETGYWVEGEQPEGWTATGKTKTVTDEPGKPGSAEESHQEYQYSRAIPAVPAKYRYSKTVHHPYVPAETHDQFDWSRTVIFPAVASIPGTGSHYELEDKWRAEGDVPEGEGWSICNQRIDKSNGTPYTKEYQWHQLIPGTPYVPGKPQRVEVQTVENSPTAPSDALPDGASKAFAWNAMKRVITDVPAIPASSETFYYDGSADGTKDESKAVYVPYTPSGGWTQFGDAQQGTDIPGYTLYYDGSPDGTRSEDDAAWVKYKPTGDWTHFNEKKVVDAEEVPPTKPVTHEESEYEHTPTSTETKSYTVGDEPEGWTMVEGTEETVTDEAAYDDPAVVTPATYKTVVVSKASDERVLIKAAVPAGEKCAVAPVSGDNTPKAPTSGANVTTVSDPVVASTVQPAASVQQVKSGSNPVVPRLVHTDGGQLAHTGFDASQVAFGGALILLGGAALLAFRPKKHLNK